MKNRILFFLLALFLIIEKVDCQVCILNGDFEQYWKMPSKIGESYKLKFWNHVTLSYYPVTFFYFPENNKKGFRPKDNNKILQKPHSKNGFIGIGIDLKSNDKNQYFQTKLNCKLIKDSLYKIEMWLSLADNIKYAVDHLNCFFSENEKLNLNKDTLLIRLRQENSEFINDKENWVKVSSVYKSNGKENFFVLNGKGSYKKNKTKLNFNLTYLLNSRLTYYFVDDITITRINSIKVDDFILEKETIPKIDVDSNKTISRRYILIFDVNDTRIDSNGQKTLNDICKYLNPNKQIEIYGFADSIGTKEYNLQLSNRRATEIYNYFIKKNIQPEKIKYYSMGESNLENNAFLNRKVEIIIY